MEMAGDPANARQGRKIVVAVDEGEESMHALSWCLDNVAGAGDTLVLLHAMPPRVVYTAMDGTGYLFSSDIIATMEKHGRQVADAVIEKARGACSRVPFPINVEAKVEKGDPRDVICETVEKLGADVLVLGSHGYGLIKRWCHDLGREQAANKPLLKTVFQVMMRLFTPRKTTLLFVVRDKTRTPLENLDRLLREDIQKIWDSVPKPQAHKETPLSEFFVVEVVALSSYEAREDEFKEQVFINNNI